MKKNREKRIGITSKAILISLCALLFPAGFSPLLSESPLDTLPLGPSPYKLIIDKIEAGQIIRARDGQTVSVNDIIADNPDAGVFIIGEAHDNYDCHVFQRDLIAALAEKYPNVIVGFEFFQREDDPVLEQWRKGEITEKELIAKTGWYKRGAQHFGLTKLIMDLIREKQIKTIGLNVPRAILNTVSRKGFAHLAAEEKALFPTLNHSNPEHEYFIKSIFGTFAAQVPMWFSNIHAAQTCWDSVMAESMRRMLAQKEYRGYKGVIIAGSNHVAYKLGIPFRYLKSSPSARLVTISPILAPPETDETSPTGGEEGEIHPMMRILGKQLPPAATFSRGVADYVFSPRQPLQPHFPTLGASIEEKNNRLEITTIGKDSIAEKNGLRKGDIITSLDNTPLTTLEQLRLILSSKNWGEPLKIGIEKTIPLENETDGKQKTGAEKKAE